MTQLSSRISEAAIQGRHFENLDRQVLDFISATREKVDFCLDSRGLPILVDDEQFLNVIKKLINAGVRLRFITNITRENISYCKILLKYCDTVYHTDRVRGNFLILDDGKYLFYVVESELESDKVQDLGIKQVLFNEDISFVDTQEYLYENLCGNSIHVKEKINEIERGFRGEFTDILQNSYAIQRIAIDILESASYKILVLFTTLDVFDLASDSGILNSLWQASKRGVAIKMLIDSDDKQSRDIVQKTINEKHLPIMVQHITKPLQNKITILVIDHSTSFAIEANDNNDTEKVFPENPIIVIYSSNDSTVSSCISIFETLWIQSEFDRQIRLNRHTFKSLKALN